MNCRVSVCMVTYNHEQYVAQAIESIVNQKTSFPFELVIGEDCSTDRTREIVLDYARKYPQLIRAITSSTNLGAKKNFVRTLEALEGEYVAFCEGDDWWHDPEKLQKQFDYMERHPECGLLHTDFRVLHRNQMIEDFQKYRDLTGCENPSASQILENLGQTFRIQTCTAMVRRNLMMQAVHADPVLHKSNRFPMGDTQLWVELALVSSVGYLSERLATYRLLDESASRSRNKAKAWQFEKSACELRLYLCEKHGMPETLRQQIDLAWSNAALRLAFYERNAALADEVRKRRGRLTIVEWTRFIGARNKFAHSAYRAASFCLGLFRKQYVG